jgi:cysteine rich repeat protein
MNRWIGMLGTMTLLAGWAAAQSGSAPSSKSKQDKKPPRALVQSCRADAKRLCPQVAGTGDKAVIRCLVQQKDQLEQGCKAALKHAKRVQAFRSACGADVKTLCGTVDPGDRRVIACLKEHQGQVSAQCKDHFTARKAGKGDESVAAVADEAAAEEQAGVEPIEEELQALPEEGPVPPATTAARPPVR